MTLVFDTTPLTHFARAGEVESLRKLCQDCRSVATQSVLEELRDGLGLHPLNQDILTATWLEEVRLGEGLDALRVFTEYTRLLGSSQRDIGEASVLAWAELNGATAIVDERAGTNHGRRRNVVVHGTLWLVIRGFRMGELSRGTAVELVDALADTEMWFPCHGSDLFDWAGRQGLL